MIKILDNDVDVFKNSRRLLKDYRVHFLIVIVTMFADSISTTLFMSADGVGSEMNHVVRLLAMRLGIVSGPMVGKVLQLVALCLLACIVPTLTRLLFWVVITINIIAVGRNLQFFWSCT